MKAIALKPHSPITQASALADVTLPKWPEPTGFDMLVRVQAVSVNPVDTKVRSSGNEDNVASKILGWDAAGVVECIGQDVTQFKVGDMVYYAGDITRPGSNAEYQLVDARITGPKPQNLTPAEAAAFPLVSLTAWEALFERLGIDPNGQHTGSSIFIIGGAGGVGSIAIQLAKLAGLTVVTTASRTETTDWVRKLGADVVINHRESIMAQLKGHGFSDVDYIANFNNTDAYWTTMAEAIKPQGKIVSIVKNEHPLDLNLLKSKSATFAWEFMFTRSMFKTADQDKQGMILRKISELIESGKLHPINKNEYKPICAQHLREAHDLLESGKAIGKTVLVGWPEK
ncbi:zinc-binding alcohol dehydrogenase family protein [Cerasicoccus frondis]|uniref:zinc-binding alcohol dehydrogenase family protein n=1 Tax=Cerasicoccus frondis TaxID=490090 RepID=UPI002852A7DE|nr:zinc-binding alcohol dehydrogenase family protein [Cerasicoccus frondis]